VPQKEELQHGGNTRMKAKGASTWWQEEHESKRSFNMVATRT